MSAATPSGTAVPQRAVWTALAAERLAVRARELAARRIRPTRTVDVPLTSPAGHPLPARLHLPAGDGPFAAWLFCAGGLDGTRGAEGLSPVITAPRLARAGYATLAWSPSGRDGAPGTEDRNGPLHQAECAAALRALLAHPLVDPARVGVLSISFGVVLATYALVRWPELADRVQVLVDWEGPPSREWFEASRLQYWTIDEDWWSHREVTHRVGALRCRYDRFQSAWDHVHGPDHGLGEEVVDAALAGGGPPWVGFNGHDARETPRRYMPVSLLGQGEALVTLLRARLPPH